MTNILQRYNWNIIESCVNHSVVCSSSIYGLWLPLWYLQTLLNTIIQPTEYTTNLSVRYTFLLNHSKNKNLICTVLRLLNNLWYIKKIMSQVYCAKIEGQSTIMIKTRTKQVLDIDCITFLFYWQDDICTVAD